MKKNKTIIILLFTFISIYAKADFVQYSDSISLKVESANFIVIHSHDWSWDVDWHWWYMLDSKNSIRVKEFGTIQCIDKKSGKTIFNRKCPPLSFLEISADEKYITGLSTIKFFNSTQLVIFDTSGKKLKERHICPNELRFNLEEYKKFKWEHAQFLMRNKHKKYKKDGNIFIDFLYVDFRSYKFFRCYSIRDFNSNNHLSSNFSESVSNWVFWYNEKHPEIEYNTIKGKLFSISLLDNGEQRFEILMHE